MKICHILGIYGATFNFVNSIVGAGLIGLPYAGMFMLTLVTILTYISTVTLVFCGIEYKRYGYEKLFHHVYGTMGYVLVSVSMFMLAFGAMCGYFIVIGDSLTPAMNFFFNLSFERNQYILFCAICFILPLSLVKDLAQLSWTSLFSILAEIIMVIIVVYFAPSVAKSQGASGTLDFAKPTVFSGVGTMAFAYVCQHSTFIVFNSLRQPTKESWKKVAKYSLIITGIICLVMSGGAFLAFLNQTEPDILQSFRENQKYIDFSRILLGITMILTYPMENFVARHCIIDGLRRIFQLDEYSLNVLSWPVTIAIWLSTLAIGLTFQNLGLIFELIGSISGIGLGLVMPSICYFKIRHELNDNDLKSNFFYFGNLVMFWFGLSVMFIGSYQALSKEQS